MGDNNFDAHLFYNEKAEIDARHNFLSVIFEIEKKMRGKEFPTITDWNNYKNNNITKKYRNFFKWNKSSFKAERNIININTHLSRSGYYVIATNKTDLNRDEVLSHYRNKDLVEKVFDMMKMKWMAKD